MWPPDMPIGDVMGSASALVNTSFVSGLLLVCLAWQVVPHVVRAIFRMFVKH